MSRSTQSHRRTVQKVVALETSRSIFVCLKMCEFEKFLFLGYWQNLFGVKNFSFLPLHSYKGVRFRNFSNSCHCAAPEATFLGFDIIRISFLRRKF